MGELWRSEQMQLVQLFVQIEAAHDTVDELGKLGLIQFKDLNPEVNSFQRNFVNEITSFEDMERKLRFFEDQIQKEKKDVEEERGLTRPLELVQVDPGLNKPETHHSMEELKSQFDDLEKELTQLNQNQEMLVRNYNELTELKHVLTKDQDFFFEAASRDELTNLSEDSSEVTDSLLGGDAAKAPIPLESKAVKLGFVTGVILTEKFPSFERVLWRATRGNLFMKHSEIDEKIRDPHTDEMEFKTVFIIFFQGARAQQKIKKLCETFGANIHQVPESAGERHELLDQVNGRLKDLHVVLDRTKKHRRSVLFDIAKYTKHWRERILKEKSIYHTMNLFNYDVGRKCLIAEGWCPKTATEKIVNAMRKATETSGALVPSILSVIQTKEEPPTYFKTNKFTAAFQNIVDSYGIARYGEVNPGTFTIVTFPFLFGVMFGDFGHGILFTLFAAYMCINEEKLGKMQLNEMIRMCYSGRYMLLLMGIFSTYVGLIYNECFSVSMDIFGTSWEYKDGATEATFSGHAYPIGVDPAWAGASNSLNYYNSLKMKLSILLGIVHMCAGICMSAVNAIHHKSALDFFGEFVPQILFMLSIFGYLCFLIVFKWMSDWSKKTPPLLLNVLINMFLSPGTVSEENKLFDNQGIIQAALVLLALVCVPWMLATKPYVLKKRNQKKIQYQQAAKDEHEAAVNDHDDHGEHGEPFEFGEIMVKQIIHTIEFVLGAISNTASYLRLWALSLAHSELSKVFWERVLMQGFEMNNPATVFLGFGAWAGATFGVLLVMESLSAFLHALRLHWVEFQNKFYHGDGHKFAPFSYEVILKPNESDG